MRASDLILAEDLEAAGLPEMARRAREGEWNDYFGEHDLPQHELIQELRAQTHISHVMRLRVINMVMDGKYDGTAEESKEWEATVRAPKNGPPSGFHPRWPH